MKILYINDQIFPNTETDGEQIMQTVSTLSLNGAILTFLIPRSWRKKGVLVSELEKYYQINGRFTVETVSSFFPSLRFFEKYGHAIRSLFSKKVKEADVIYSRNLPTIVMMLIFTKKPVVYETFRNWPDQLFYMPLLFKWLGNRKKFLGAVLHSNFAAESYRKIGFPEHKLFPIHNGYDPERIKPVLTKNEARTLLQLPLNQKIITYTGNVSIQKGIGFLLDMAEKIQDSLFVIVGSKGDGEIEKRAANIKNVKIVSWQPFRETVPYLYASDILIIPPTLSPLEKVGNTVLPIKTFLYMASGRTIFAPQSPDLAEILDSGKNALLVKPDNLGVAVSSLNELLKNEKMVKNLGETAQKDAENLTYQKRAEQIISFIKRALEGVK